jgi:hypothetical protein
MADQVPVYLVGMHARCSECAWLLMPGPMNRGERHTIVQCGNPDCTLMDVKLRFELPVVQCERVG